MAATSPGMCVIHCTQGHVQFAKLRYVLRLTVCTKNVEAIQNSQMVLAFTKL